MGARVSHSRRRRLVPELKAGRTPGGGGGSPERPGAEARKGFAVGISWLAPRAGHRAGRRTGSGSAGAAGARGRLLPGAAEACSLEVGLPTRLGHPGTGPLGPQPPTRRVIGRPWGFKYELPTPTRPLQPRFGCVAPTSTPFSESSASAVQPHLRLKALHPSFTLPPLLCICPAACVKHLLSMKRLPPKPPLLLSLCTHSHICFAPLSDTVACSCSSFGSFCRAHLLS